MENSVTTDIKGEGDVILKWTSRKELKLKNILYVPKIRKNIVSGWLLNKYGFRLAFECNTFELTMEHFVRSKDSKEYCVRVVAQQVWISPCIWLNTNSTYVVESSNVQHGRLGHVNYNSIRLLMKSNCIPTFHIDSNHTCQTCVEAKMTRSSFHSVERKTDPLDLIHTDVCDLNKDEAIDMFILYKNEVENQLNKKIKVVRSDRGGEYVSPFAEFCSQHGIRHEFTTPYSPHQNGIAERENRTLKEMANAIKSVKRHRVLLAARRLIIFHKGRAFSRTKVSQRSYRHLKINQAKYALETLKKYGMDLTDPVDTPMVDRLKLERISCITRPCIRCLWIAKDNAKVTNTYAESDHAMMFTIQNKYVEEVLRFLGEDWLAVSIQMKQISTAITTTEAEYKIAMSWELINLNSKGHQILRNVYEPLPLRGPPGQLKAARYLDFGLEELVPSLWVESERDYDISAAYGITHCLHLQDKLNHLPKSDNKDTLPILLSFTHCGNKSILRVLRIILVILPEHPSETKVFHNEDGNPARANIKQALGSYERSHKGVKASANSDIVYFFTSAQDGDPLQDDVRLCLGDDLKKAQDHNQRQVKDESKDHYPKCNMCVQNGYHATKLFLFDGTQPIVKEEFQVVKEYSLRLFAREDVEKSEKITGLCDVSWKKMEEYTKIWSINEDVNSNSKLPDTPSLFWP
ncbi:retrovirus-related pol polyprotein from transposon TNT 1-94 [Tanacetum coccineum]